MKSTILSIISITFLLPATVSYSNCDANYSKLDQALIGLWHHSMACDHDGAKHALDHIVKEWNLMVPELYKYLNPTVNLEQFNRDMVNFIVSMKISLDERDYIDLGKFSKKMLYQFKYFREHHTDFTSTSYPLYYILNMVEYYSEIGETVHDQMFGLKYWFEFEDIVNAFQSEWKAFDSKSTAEIKKCFPFITNIEHNSAKEKVEKCLSYFLASLESGYRSDFEIPCDELGGALYELMVLYGNVDRSDLSYRN